MKKFNLFLLISTIGLIFTEILLYFFTDIVGLYYLISKIIAAIIVLFFPFQPSYLLRLFPLWVSLIKMHYFNILRHI